MARTTGDFGVLGLMEATSVCRKINVSTTVSAMLSRVSDWDGINTEAIPVKATSSRGMIKL